MMAVLGLNPSALPPEGAGEGAGGSAPLAEGAGTGEGAAESLAPLAGVGCSMVFVRSARAFFFMVLMKGALIAAGNRVAERCEGGARERRGVVCGRSKGAAGQTSGEVRRVGNKPSNYERLQSFPASSSSSTYVEF